MLHRLFPCLALFCACGGARAAAPAGDATPVATVAAVPVPPASSAVVAVIAPPAAAGAPATECTLTQDGWASPTPRALRTPSGAVFAEISGADRLVVSTRTGPALQVRVHGTVLETVPHEGDLPVYSRSPRLFAEVLLAGPGTALQWRPEGEGLRVTLPTDRRVRLEGARVASGVVACSALALVGLPANGVIADHAIAGPREVAVSASPDGPTVARLAVPARTLVQVQETKGTRAKVAWYIDGGPLDDASVVGWIDASLLRDGAAGNLDGRGSALGGMSGTSDWVGCRSAHPLFVDAGKGPEQVGTLEVGTQVRTLGKSGAMKAVEIVGPAVRPSPSPLRLRGGARFVVADDVAKDCGGT